ncbi:hypothetical protein BESB_061650 [Besnoitia besnoiti]|uniref:Transmembrane protein n=1 Tax=Besnoitia besnoiti TaxID=94643 RepID=A0A2A9M9X5_BESBE|nr:hypothetical protein BESB_061650 [Besnoitia besnoiti]PFH35278.1 hypothetical protein BESB_061650 [Besnoitia besnoiti]
MPSPDACARPSGRGVGLEGTCSLPSPLSPPGALAAEPAGRTVCPLPPLPPSSPPSRFSSFSSARFLAGASPRAAGDACPPEGLHCSGSFRAFSPERRRAVRAAFQGDNQGHREDERRIPAAEERGRSGEPDGTEEMRTSAANGRGAGAGVTEGFSPQAREGTRLIPLETSTSVPSSRSSSPSTRLQSRHQAASSPRSAQVGRARAQSLETDGDSRAPSVLFPSRHAAASRSRLSLSEHSVRLGSAALARLRGLLLSGRAPSEARVGRDRGRLGSGASVFSQETPRGARGSSRHQSSSTDARNFSRKVTQWRVETTLFLYVINVVVHSLNGIFFVLKGQRATGAVILLTQTTAWVFSALLYAVDREYLKALLAILGLAVFVEVKPNFPSVGRRTVAAPPRFFSSLAAASLPLEPRTPTLSSEAAASVSLTPAAGRSPSSARAPAAAAGDSPPSAALASGVLRASGEVGSGAHSSRRQPAAREGGASTSSAAGRARERISLRASTQQQLQNLQNAWVGLTQFPLLYIYSNVVLYGGGQLFVTGDEITSSAEDSTLAYSFLSSSRSSCFLSSFLSLTRQSATVAFCSSLLLPLSVFLSCITVGWIMLDRFLGHVQKSRPRTELRHALHDTSLRCLLGLMFLFHAVDLFARVWTWCLISDDAYAPLNFICCFFLQTLNLALYLTLSSSFLHCFLRGLLSLLVSPLDVFLIEAETPRQVRSAMTILALRLLDILTASLFVGYRTAAGSLLPEESENEEDGTLLVARLGGAAVSPREYRVLAALAEKRRAASRLCSVLVIVLAGLLLAIIALKRRRDAVEAEALRSLLERSARLAERMRANAPRAAAPAPSSASAAPLSASHARPSALPASSFPLSAPASDSPSGGSSASLFSLSSPSPYVSERGPTSSFSSSESFSASFSPHAYRLFSISSFSSSSPASRLADSAASPLGQLRSASRLHEGTEWRHGGGRDRSSEEARDEATAAAQRQALDSAAACKAKEAEATETQAVGEGGRVTTHDAGNGESLGAGGGQRAIAREGEKGGQGEESSRQAAGATEKEVFGGAQATTGSSGDPPTQVASGMPTGEDGAAEETLLKSAGLRLKQGRIQIETRSCRAYEVIALTAAAPIRARASRWR